MDLDASPSCRGVSSTTSNVVHQQQPSTTTHQNGKRHHHQSTGHQQDAGKHSSPPWVHASHSPSVLEQPQQPQQPQQQQQQQQDWSERAGTALRRVASTLSRGAAGDGDVSVRSASTRRGWLGGSRHGAAGADASAHGGDLSVHSGKSLRRAQSVYNVDGELEGTVHTQCSMPLTSSSRGASRRGAPASPGEAGGDSTHLGTGADASASRGAVPLFGRVLPAPSAASLEDPADSKHGVGAGGGDGGSNGVDLPSLGPGLVVREVSATGHIHIISVVPADKKSGDWLMHAHTVRSWLCNYFRKWKGGKDTPLARDSWLDLVFSWIGAFCGILLVSALHKFLSPKVDTPLMIASFGASAVLLFGVPNSKMAQPRNCLGGHVLSAIVGIITRIALQDVVWVSAPLGMSVALTVMQLTGTTHPPGGATALIAASAPYIGDWEGFKFLLTVFFGSLALIIVALITNNASPTRSYPTFWY